MKAIRGAITVDADSPEEIRKSVKELLDTLKNRNCLTDSQIICIMFSNTQDIRSYYPAKAGREAGYVTCALYSSVEPEIDGSLEKCIRVMILADTDRLPEHVYLKDAQNLRRDISHKLNIAIDGPAGSGKSTVAKIISEKFDILYLDTGAMYRACALACLHNGIDVKNQTAVGELLKKTEISVEYRDGLQVTKINDKDVSAEIRTPEISMSASAVSALKCVREEMVRIQRKIAETGSCVLDGRDIGTNVLPDAEYKFFLTASPEVRAERRLKENRLKGIEQSFEAVLNEIKQRDSQDMERTIAPLVKASDAVEIITDAMNAEEVAGSIINYIQRKI